MLPGVSKTAILTMRARADEHARADRIFEDPIAAQWWTRVEWPAELDRWYGPFSRDTLAFRAHDIDRIVERYAGVVTTSLSVTELGCGLSTRKARLHDTPIAWWLDVDLPEVCALRTAWGVDSPQLGQSVLDFSWMDHIEGDPTAQVFIAEGLFYYLPRADVDRLLAALRARFAGSVLVMDVLGANDFPKLLEETKAIGSPIEWKHEGDFEDVLDAFGLREVEGFEAGRLQNDMMQRYWHRFSEVLRGAIYFAMNCEPVWAARSGNILGRL